MPPSRPEPPIERPSKALREEARVVASLLRRHGWPLVLLFAGLLLPLEGVAELADEVRAAEGFPFDKPILLAANQMAISGVAQLILFFVAIGYQSDIGIRSCRERVSK